MDKQPVLKETKEKYGDDLFLEAQLWGPNNTYLHHELRDTRSYKLKKFEFVSPQGVSKSMLI